MAKGKPFSKNTRLNLVIRRLAACCGLGASEVATLRVGDVHTQLPRPHLKIRVGAAKGARSRTVPLWWDAGTLADISAWKTDLMEWGAMGDAPECKREPYDDAVRR